MSKTRKSKKCKARPRRRYSKKGGHPPPIDIQRGDILVMNFGGRVPFTSYKHVAVAVQGLVNDKKATFLLLAHCARQGCILSGLEYTPNKNNKTIWVLRYRGDHAKELKNVAAFIAEKWASSEKLKFSQCGTLRVLLPCFAHKADRKTGIRYIQALMSHSLLPRYNNEKYINMFCSKFGLAVWMAVLGYLYIDEDENDDDDNEDEFNWKALDKCLPLKPSNCAPWDLISLPKKLPECWEKVGEFKGWGRFTQIPKNLPKSAGDDSGS